MIRLILACVAVCVASYVVTVGHVETWCIETSQGMWDCGDGERAGVEIDGQVYERGER